MAESPPPVQSTPAECSSSRHFNDLRIEVPVQNSPLQLRMEITPLWPPEKIDEWQLDPDLPGGEFYLCFKLHWQDKRNIECITGRSCLRLSKLKKRKGALSKQLFSPEPNHRLYKENLDYHTKIALHNSFCIFCGHFLNTYPQDSNLSFGQPRPEILHIASVVF